MAKTKTLYGYQALSFRVLLEADSQFLCRIAPVLAATTGGLDR
jgi:hypothetical protein